MSPSIDVSVVIPVYNGEAFIGEAIESVLAQQSASSPISVQLIVVDNNSTDGTRQLVTGRFGDRVSLLHEPQQNAAQARNTGARHATRPWLAFLDADDLWLPNKIDAQFQSMADRPHADLFFTHASEFHHPGLSAEERRLFPCRPDPYPMISGTNLLLRREVFQRIGDFPPFPSGEFIAWYGWAHELGFVDRVVPDILVQRRIHATNSTRSRTKFVGYADAMKWLMDRRRARAASPLREGA